MVPVEKQYMMMMPTSQCTAIHTSVFKDNKPPPYESVLK